MAMAELLDLGTPLIPSPRDFCLRIWHYVPRQWRGWFSGPLEDQGAPTPSWGRARRQCLYLLMVRRWRNAENPTGLRWRTIPRTSGVQWGRLFPTSCSELTQKARCGRDRKPYHKRNGLKNQKYLTQKRGISEETWHHDNYISISKGSFGQRGWRLQTALPWGRIIAIGRKLQGGRYMLSRRKKCLPINPAKIIEKPVFF